jgi:hypothetical protein
MMFSRAFTLPEANALIPLLEDNLGRMHAQLLQARALQDEIEGTRASADGAAGVASSAGDAHKALTRLEKSMAQTLAHVATWGVAVKGLDPVLVDVPAVRAGERVHLCWQLGEPSFSHWHSLDDGAEGRRVITDDDDFGAPVLQ